MLSAFKRMASLIIIASHHMMTAVMAVTEKLGICLKDEPLEAILAFIRAVSRLTHTAMLPCCSIMCEL